MGALWVSWQGILLASQAFGANVLTGGYSDWNNGVLICADFLVWWWIFSFLHAQGPFFYLVAVAVSFC